MYVKKLCIALVSVWVMLASVTEVAVAAVTLPQCQAICHCIGDRCGALHSCRNQNPLNCCPGTDKLQHCLSAEAGPCYVYRVSSNCTQYCEGIHTCGHGIQ